ncbi:hypothetical protein AAMO2058_000650300 [Amorphochlora amoebiformis]
MNDGLFGLGQHVTILHSVQDELVSSLIAARDEIHQIRGGMNEIKIYLAREQHHFQKTLRDLAHAIGSAEDFKKRCSRRITSVWEKNVHLTKLYNNLKRTHLRTCQRLQQRKDPSLQSLQMAKSLRGNLRVLKGCNAGLKKEVKISVKATGKMISSLCHTLELTTRRNQEVEEQNRVLLQRYSSITQGMKSLERKASSLSQDLQRVKFEKAQEAANNAFVREKLRQEIKVLHRDKTDALKVMVDLQKELEALRRKFQERKGIFVRTEEYYTESLGIANRVKRHRFTPETPFDSKSNQDEITVLD